MEISQIGPKNLDPESRAIGFHDLPDDIVSRIFSQFALPRNPLSREAYFEPGEEKPWTLDTLRRLRLVSKASARQAIPYLFRSIKVENPLRAETLIQNWSNFLPHAPDYSNESCPVRRLVIKAVWVKRSSQSYEEILQKSGILDGTAESAPETPYLAVDSESNEGPPTIHPPIDRGAFNRPPPEYAPKDDPIGPSLTCPMDQVMRLLELFGENLEELHLGFVNSFAFPSALLDVIGRMQGLHSLYIYYKPSKELPSGLYHTKTIIDLLKRTPHLQVLSIDHPNLPDFTSSDVLLPSLRCLSLSGLQKGSSSGVNSLSKLVKNTVKILEVNANVSSWAPFMPVVEGLESNLEVLFTNSKQMLKALSQVEFPRLQLLGLTRLRTEDLRDPAFQVTGPLPTWSIFRNVRMIASNGRSIQIQWGSDIQSYVGCRDFMGGLMWLPPHPFHGFPKLKDLVVVRAPSRFGGTILSFQEHFTEFGIPCHELKDIDIQILIELNDLLKKTAKDGVASASTII